MKHSGVARHWRAAPFRWGFGLAAPVLLLVALPGCNRQETSPTASENRDLNEAAEMLNALPEDFAIPADNRTEPADDDSR